MPPAAQASSLPASSRARPGLRFELTQAQYRNHGGDVAGQFLENYRDTIDRLFAASNADSWHVSRSTFAAALYRSFERRFGANANAVSRVEAIQFLESLHARD